MCWQWNGRRNFMRRPGMRNPEQCNGIEQVNPAAKDKMLMIAEN
jgi:hypothetical protein